jgi:hypothetical protein
MEMVYLEGRKNFYCLNIIMPDDIGTKIPIDKITFPPTFPIKTSPNNYQVGLCQI